MPASRGFIGAVPGVRRGFTAPRAELTITDWEIIHAAVTDIGSRLGTDPASEAARDYV
jgi:hypothetical protein